MTIIENNSPKQIYTGPFSKDTPIPLTFPYISKHHVHAIMNNSEIIQPRDFEVIENSIKLTADWPKDSTLTVYRITTLDQQSPFPQQSKFRSERIEQALDKLCMQNQEQEEQLGRTVKVPISKKTFDGTMPYPVPGRTLKINSDASGFELSELDVDDAYAQTNQYKVEAQLARDEAQNQANIATSQAGIAADKANASANSATQAAETLAAAVTTITTEKEEAIEAVQNQQVNSINAVKSQQNTSVNALKAEGTTQVNLAKAEVTKATTQANNAKTSATNAQTYATQAQTTLNNATTTINTEKTNAVNAVKTQQSTSISAVQSQQNSSVNTVKSTGQSYIDKCKAWASSDRAVEGGLYSAKHYAEMAQGKSDVTYEHLRASRVYDDKGMLLTDEEGYADVVEMNRSTFDLSKFTVKGSPNITEAGVASGLTKENSIQVILDNAVTMNNKSFILKNKYKVGTNNSKANMLYCLSSLIRTELGVNRKTLQSILPKDIFKNDTTVYCAINFDNVVSVDDVFDFEMILNLENKTFTIKAKKDGKTYEASKTIDLKDDFMIQGLNIGSYYGSTDFFWQGLIDLKQFSITVDGKEVFNGNKTGLDVIKEDYTVIGSPVISDDGVASGFLKDTSAGYDSSPNCIRTTGFTLGQLKDKPWRMECSFVLPTITAPTNKALYSLGQTSRWEAWSNTLSVSSDGKSFQLPSKFGTDENPSGNIAIKSWATFSSIGVIPGNSYTYITDFDGVSAYTYKIKDNKTGNILAQYQYTPTTENKNLYMVNKYPNETINIGTANSAYTNQYSGWTGSIDLNAFKIYIDDELVYQPCLKIPYNLSKNGAKVVPAYARDRVLDVYENHDKGYAYYTIDEENKNFTLPLGTTFDNSLRRNLENITENGNEKLATSLMYETGNVSNDEKGYKQLEKMNRSTFDLSKFTVVGSPTITDDGVASGFYKENHILFNTAVNSYNTQIKLRYTWNGIKPTASTWIFRGSDNAVSGTDNMSIFQGSNGRIEVYFVKEGAEYYNENGVYIEPNIPADIILSKTENTFGLKVIQNGQVLSDLTKDISTSYFRNLVCTINGFTDRVLQGSIDLKQFSIAVDGKEVFNGNKNGLDIIKEDNIEVVGSPVISEDGVASGFAYDRNYFRLPQTINIENGIEICLPIKLSKLNTAQGLIYDKSDNRFTISITSNNRVKFSVFAIAKNAYISVDGTSTLSLNKWYYIKLKYDKTKLYIYMSTDGINYRLDNYIAFNDTPIKTIYNGLNIGNAWGNDVVFSGSIDLNSFKIYVDGNLVYQPCLKISYNVSKTGSKIVPAEARARVIDLYEQEGHAGYYTIDEEKKNFTLPMGEIFGLIGQRSLRSVTRDGANYCEIYSDKTIEQGGTCTANVEVTLQQPFADTNYVLSVPYSSKTATSFIPTQTGDWIAKGKGV